MLDDSVVTDSLIASVSADSSVSLKSKTDSSLSVLDAIVSSVSDSAKLITDSSCVFSTVSASFLTTPAPSKSILLSFLLDLAIIVSNCDVTSSKL